MFGKVATAFLLFFITSGSSNILNIKGHIIEDTGHTHNFINCMTETSPFTYYSWSNATLFWLCELHIWRQCYTTAE